MLSIELQKPRFALIEEAPPGDERQALLVQLFAVNLIRLPEFKDIPVGEICCYRRSCGPRPRPRWRTVDLRQRPVSCSFCWFRKQRLYNRCGLSLWVNRTAFMHLMEFHQPKGVVAFETCKLACNTFLNNKHVLFDLLPSLPQKLRARPTESLFGEPPFRVPSASFATLIMREHFMAISFLRNYLNIFRCIAGVFSAGSPVFGGFEGTPT